MSVLRLVPDSPLPYRHRSQKPVRVDVARVHNLEVGVSVLRLVLVLPPVPVVAPNEQPPVPSVKMVKEEEEKEEERRRVNC